MNIPKLRKNKTKKNYHGITLEDDYSWVDQPNILEVLKDPKKLDSEVKDYIEANNNITENYFKDVKDFQKHLFNEIKDKIKLVDEKELDLSYFDERNKQNASFRNGFWPLTSRRLFCVYEYIKKYSVEKCFHLENDTMVYTDLSKMIEKLENKLYITLDAPNRCIAGIMFIPKFYNMVPLIENYQYNKNDMLNLVRFYIKNRIFFIL